MQNYQIKKKAVYEILDTETIVINFSTGDYYTLPCVAKQLWQMLEKNASTEMIVTTIVNYYQCNANEADDHIKKFLQQLVIEGLIEASSSPAVCDYDLNNLLVADAQYQWEYSCPDIHKYSDIGNLLLLDPIHDVDSSGWPNQPAENESISTN